jgi:beta-glucosidase
VTAELRFPDGFAWGVATASYQIEGAVHEGGRSPSIWDTFSHTPGAIFDGHTGDVADDHYHRYREDIGLMADLGISHYRFSLAWPRLQRDGRGPINAAGLDFYERLLDALNERGIEPCVTLYHWDLPQALQDAGGWPARDTAQRFAEYAAAVYERLHDRIALWTTLNEPWVVAYTGHAEGRHAPGLRDPEAAHAAARHLLLGHSLAIEAMRAQGDAGSRFGITLNLSPVDPASEAPADVNAARRVDGLLNRQFLDPVLASDAPPLDFLGINYYMRYVVRAGQPHGQPTPWAGCEDVEFVSRGLPTTDMGWEIDADGLYDVVMRIDRDYRPVPLYITENGIALGGIADAGRIAYLDSHLRAAHRAIADGADLRGYFVWTLMDNFEWARGYSMRFGLIHVDYETLERTPKDSARWFAQVTRRNGLRDTERP